MTKQVFIATPPPHPARFLAQKAIQEAPDGYVVTIAPPKRSLASNALMWALLTELHHQVEWYGQHPTPSEWKDIITASIKRQKVVPGIDGGFVVCGSSTSAMSGNEINEVIEAIYAFGLTRDPPVDFKVVT